MTKYESKYVACAKMYTSNTVLYSKYIGPKRLRKPPVKKVTKIILSEQTARKIRKTIDFIADTSQWKKVPCFDLSCQKAKHSPGKCHWHWFRIGFLTLTLPAPQLSEYGRFQCFLLNQGVIVHSDLNLKSYEDYDDDYDYSQGYDSDFFLSDNRIKDFCLNHFLTILREKYKVSKYLWKAETQRNGNIHFHIVIDQFIHWKVLQYVWNRVLSKTTLIDDFEKKFGHRNPPTIEVHAVKKITSLRRYLTAYLAKSEDRKRKIDGRRWAASETCKASRGVEIELTGIKADEFEQLDNIPQSYIWRQDHFVLYRLKIGQIAYLLPHSVLMEEYCTAMSDLTNIPITFN